MLAPREAHITTIAVDPAWHRNHVGTKLMLGLIDAATAKGARSVSLEVRKSNLGAQRMYERFGFRPVGVRRGHYDESGPESPSLWASGPAPPSEGWGPHPPPGPRSACRGHCPARPPSP